MAKHREQSLKNRSDILRKCYPLLATGSWDAITVADLENVIMQTRGQYFIISRIKKPFLSNS